MPAKAATQTILRFGREQSLAFSFRDGALVANCASPATAIEDWPAALRAALDSPLEYPPLRQAATPGDRVALAIDRDLPQAPEVVAQIIAYLQQAGVNDG